MTLTAGDLKKAAVAKQVDAAGSQGNASIKLTGKDGEGNRLDTTNDGMSPKVSLAEVPEGIDASARMFTGHFDQLTKSGVLRLPKPVDKVKRQIEAAWDAWKKAK